MDAKLLAAQILLLEVFPEFKQLDNVKINNNNAQALVRFAKTITRNR